MSDTAVLQLHHREDFERNVTRALVAGAGAGAVAFLTTRLHVPVPLSFLALAATSLACVRGDKMDRLMLAGLSLVLPALPWLFGLAQGWTIAFAGAAAGALMVKSRLAEKGEEGSVGADRPGALHYGLTALATAGLALAGTEVARVLELRLGQLAAPFLLTSVVAGATVALFAGIGSIAAHVALKSDPVEARFDELLPILSSQFQEQAQKAMSTYRQCGQSLAALPREPAREDLARTVQKLTRDALELAGEWAGVESQLHEETHRDLAAQVADLQKSARESKDHVARRQLELAAQSLVEELGRLEEMKLKRERVVARLKSQVALLERAKVALIGMRSSQASVRAAEMTAVSRKLSALAVAQADEAKLAHEVATNVEMAAQEAQVLENKAREQVAVARAAGLPSASEPAPVSTPEPSSTQAAPIANAEKAKA